MPKRDKYHDAVRTALEKDGWTITDDPLTVPTPDFDFYIDLGAERNLIGAEKGGAEIAVEIKSLLRNSYFYDFYQALGQFMIYRLAMNKKGMNMPLFLAVPNLAFEALFQVSIFKESLAHYSVHILVFDENEKIILQWLKH
ncbi:MAG: fatty-acid oxidation protein subunit alpha [Lewinellaceae bacterium]|nr:XisH protein [Saprospiraceae bacterium]MCB9339915.1 fatty-acid oxidation protein subunit alpha [Lewinellaceae bacterium]